jgi:hypothetical protein
MWIRNITLPVVKNKNKSLRDFCENNKIISLRLLMKKYKYLDLDEGLMGACKGGHQRVVELMIEKGANYWNLGLNGACEGGKQSLVELMIEKGANRWNRGMERACLRGHQRIVELMIEKGANNWNLGMMNACIGGRQHLVELMIEKGATECGWCTKSINDHLDQD